MNNETIIQAREFKAGEYGELVLVGQPVMWDFMYETFPSARAEQAGEAADKEEAVGKEAGGAEAAPKRTARAVGEVVEEPRYDDDEESKEPEPEAADPRFGEPRMAFYASNAPDIEWSKLSVVEKNERMKWRGTNAPQRALRIVHPKGCPFEGRVVIMGRG